MSREAFEKLPEISKILERSVQWSEKFKIYHVKVSGDFEALRDVSCVAGAWMAWQEQQKQIDEYELVADSLDDLYQRERAKNKALQQQNEEVEGTLKQFYFKADLATCEAVHDSLRGLP